MFDLFLLLSYGGIRGAEESGFFSSFSLLLQRVTEQIIWKGTSFRSTENKILVNLH